MNKFRSSFLFVCWLTLALALLPALRAQDTPPAAPPPAPPAAPAPTAEKAPEAAPADDKAVAPEAKKADGELRNLAPDEGKPDSSTKKRPRLHVRPFGVQRSSEEPPHFGDQTVSSDRTQSAAVTIFGNTTVDGHLTDAAVSVFGNTTVNGTVDDAAVSVFGTTTINGQVKGEAVAVFGDMVLGPQADIGGETVVVFGKLTRAPGSQIHGGIQEVGNFGPFRNAGDGLRAWINSCLLMGRPLWIGENLGNSCFQDAFQHRVLLLQCLYARAQHFAYRAVAPFADILLNPVGFGPERDSNGLVGTNSHSATPDVTMS